MSFISEPTYLSLELPSLDLNNINDLDLINTKDLINTENLTNTNVNKYLIYNYKYKMVYINILMLHLHISPLSHIKCPVIPYFDSVLDIYNFENNNTLPYKELNYYIYEFKKTFNDNKIKYINNIIPNILHRSCVCNKCTVCLNKHNSYLEKYIPVILEYMSNYPLLDGYDNYPTINTSIEHINEYITIFNSTYNNITNFI